MGGDGDNVDFLATGQINDGGGSRLANDNVRLDAEAFGPQAFGHPVEIGLGFGFLLFKPGLLGHAQFRRNGKADRK